MLTDQTVRHDSATVRQLDDGADRHVVEGSDRSLAVKRDGNRPAMGAHEPRRVRLAGVDRDRSELDLARWELLRDGLKRVDLSLAGPGVGGEEHERKRLPATHVQ